MPPARRSTTKKSTARVSKTTAAVRARAASTSAATRREVEQSISRFEKRLDDANDALKTLGGHLGRGATGSYKDVTAALTSLRREASKTNKQALKDFDSLRGALTQKTSAARTNTRKKTSSTAKKRAPPRKLHREQAFNRQAFNREALDRQALYWESLDGLARAQEQLTQPRRRPSRTELRTRALSRDRSASALRRRARPRRARGRLPRR